MEGWRARIGVLFPADGANDDDFWRLVPPGVTVHVARTRPLVDDFSVDAYGRLAGEDVESQAALLGLIRPSSVAYACTSGSFIRGVEYDEDISARVRQASGAPATTTSTAMVNAVRSSIPRKQRKRWTRSRKGARSSSARRSVSTSRSRASPSSTARR